MPFNAKVSTSATTSETTTKEDTWSVDKTIQVQNMKSVEMIWSIGEQKLDINFTADVTLSGFAGFSASDDDGNSYMGSVR